MMLIAFILLLFLIIAMSFVIFNQFEEALKPALVAIFIAFAAGMLAVHVAIHWQYGEIIYPDTEEVESSE